MQRLEEYMSKSEHCMEDGITLLRERVYLLMSQCQAVLTTKQLTHYVIMGRVYGYPLQQNIVTRVTQVQDYLSRVKECPDRNE